VSARARVPLSQATNLNSTFVFCHFLPKLALFSLSEFALTARADGKAPSPMKSMFLWATAPSHWLAGTAERLPACAVR
jgi:hypothetical protein